MITSSGTLRHQCRGARPMSKYCTPAVSRNLRRTLQYMYILKKCGAIKEGAVMEKYRSTTLCTAAVHEDPTVNHCYTLMPYGLRTALKRTRNGQENTGKNGVEFRFESATVTPANILETLPREVVRIHHRIGSALWRRPSTATQLSGASARGLDCEC